MKFKSLISISLIAATAFGAPIAVMADAKQEAKKKAIDIIEEKILEVGKLEGALEELEQSIEETQLALKNARKSRVRGTLLFGVSAVVLTALTIKLGAMAAHKPRATGNIADGFAMMFNFIFGAGALISGAGAVGTGYVVYLKFSDVKKLEAKLIEIQDDINETKDSLVEKREELQKLKDALVAPE